MPNRAQRRHPDTINLAATATTSLPPVAKGELLLLGWVPDDDVPEQHRAYVRRETDKAAGRLGLGHVAVRYFDLPQPGRPPDFTWTAPDDEGIPLGVANGRVERMTIGILAGLRGAAVKAVIAHECRHVLQYERGLARDEADAEAFSFEYVAGGRR